MKTMQTENSTALATATTDEKLFDLCMIEHLCRGNHDKVKNMIQVFVDQMPESVEQIKLAYKKNDFTVIKNVAHRIKPVLSYYAIVKIEKDVKQIEKLADTGVATNELEFKIKKLDDVISTIVDQMKNIYLN